MLRCKDRSPIPLRHQKGWTNTQMAAECGHHRDTLAKVLRQPVAYQSPPRQRTSTIAVFDRQLEHWLDQKLGYLPLDPHLGSTSYERMRGRDQKGATVITSNKRRANWGEVMAILDRLLHHSEGF